MPIGRSDAAFGIGTFSNGRIIRVPCSLLCVEAAVYRLRIVHWFCLFVFFDVLSSSSVESTTADSIDSVVQFCVQIFLIDFYSIGEVYSLEAGRFGCKSSC